MRMIANKIDIEYEIFGEGRPIVFVHGFGDEHISMVDCMEPIFKEIEGYKRIYFDLPMMGASEDAEWIKCSDDVLDIVIDFIGKVIPGESFLVVGKSYGGYISQGLAHHLPEQVDGLLLICPVVVATHNKRTLPEHVVLEKDEKMMAEAQKNCDEDFRTYLDNYVSTMVVQNQYTFTKYKEMMVPIMKRRDTDRLLVFRDSNYSFSFNLNEKDRRFEKPVQFLLGRQDACVGYKDALDVMDIYPRATALILDIAGHALEVEQPELFKEMVHEWLKRL
ncbi:MAG: alpha/beta hydrolase [Spirochaetales bacterium]|nr:alpha/beta hydrolase [Spirochaetales bacterium]